MGRLGTGITISDGTFSFEALSVNGVDINRAEVDDFHMTSTAMTALVGKIKPIGAIEGDAVFDPDTAGNIPIDADPTTWTVTFPTVSGQTTGATLAGLGALTRFDWTGPLEERQTASWRLKWTGEPIWTPGS